MSWQDPPVADFDNDATYRWPFWNVEVDEGDLFGDLHERFNTAPMFIQDPEAFHSDVSAIAQSASSKEEFYARLKQKRDERLGELHDFIHELDHFRDKGYHSFDDQQSFTHFRLTSFATLDCLVAFLASLIRPNKTGRVPSVKDFSRLRAFSQALPDPDRSGATPVVLSSLPRTPDEPVSSPPHVKLQSSPGKGEKKRRFSAAARSKDTERRSKRRRTIETEPVVHGKDVPEEPPVQEPPVQEPPVQEPPVQEPPVQEPPVQEPPVQEPPVQQTADRKKAEARNLQPNGKKAAETNVKVPRGFISSRQSEDLSTRRSARLAGRQLNRGKRSTRPG